jgi:hypothetical protein
MGTGDWLEEAEDDDESAARDSLGNGIGIDEPTVVCAMCGSHVSAGTAHPHDGRWIGDKCCWNERMTTE